MCSRDTERALPRGAWRVRGKVGVKSVVTRGLGRQWPGTGSGHTAPPDNMSKPRTETGGHQVPSGPDSAQRQPGHGRTGQSPQHRGIFTGLLEARGTAERSLEKTRSKAGPACEANSQV